MSWAGLSVQQGDMVVCYLKAEVVAAGALAAREGPPGGEAAAAWAPGPAEHPSEAARQTERPRENREKRLGEESRVKGCEARDGASCLRAVNSLSCDSLTLHCSQMTCPFSVSNKQLCLSQRSVRREQ